MYSFTHHDRNPASVQSSLGKNGFGDARSSGHQQGQGVIRLFSGLASRDVGNRERVALLVSKRNVRVVLVNMISWAYRDVDGREANKDMCTRQPP